MVALKHVESVKPDCLKIYSGFLTEPMKSTKPVLLSRIAKKNGRSTFITNGGGGTDVTPILTDVAAAATVSSSFTSHQLLCNTSEMKILLPEIGRAHV